MFCGNTGTQFHASANAASTSWFAALRARAATLFAPTPAFAQSLCDVDCSFGGVGGLGSEWSPFGSTLINIASVTLTYDQQPSGGFVNTNDTVKVHARTGTNDLPGMTVTITITGNNGLPANVSGNVAVTDANGVATFNNLQFTKAGGYTIQAVGTMGTDPTQTQAVISQLFNIKNQ